MLGDGMKTISNNSWFKPIRRVLGFEPVDWQALFRSREVDNLNSKITGLMYSIDPVSIGRVELLTKNPIELYQVFDWLRNQDIYAIISHKLFVTPGTSTIIIDIDSFGGISASIDFLINLRLGQPNLKVIAFSSEFSKDDWLTERLQVADICLRFPITFARLDFALSEAEINNEVWQDRRRVAESLDGWS
jgi:hypothetical protein